MYNAEKYRQGRSRIGSRGSYGLAPQGYINGKYNNMSYQGRIRHQYSINRESYEKGHSRGRQVGFYCCR